MTECSHLKRQGLNADEVERSRREHGANVFSRTGKKSFLRVFFSNLGDPVIKVLLIALGLHLLLLIFHDCDWIETVGIAVSVLLATCISTISEYGSEAAFTRLFESCGVALCRVRREKIREIPTAEVVVGDIVLLGAGERIPADGVLL